jgi:hypothetical protein
MSAEPVERTEAGDLLTDPHARLSLSLVLSLVLWAPFGLAALRSELDVVQAGLRYLVAFLGCRLAVGGITHLVASYRHLQDADDPERSSADVTPLGRRAADVA